MGKGVLVAVIVGVGAVGGPALANAGPTITALGNDRYDQTDVTITAGDFVAFANAGGFHNFAFDDGEAYPPDPAPETDPVWNGLRRTFTQPGTYPFRCEAHPDRMQGVVRVTAPSTPTPPPAPAPAPPGAPPPAPLPAPAPGGDTGLEVRTLRPAGQSFCVRRTRRCRRPGVRVRIDLSRAARVSGVLTRRGRRFGRVGFGTVDAGPRTLRFTRTAAGRRLRPGRYALAVTVEGTAPRRLRFRVR